jgi:hypothetical protein
MRKETVDYTSFLPTRLRTPNRPCIDEFNARQACWKKDLNDHFLHLRINCIQAENFKESGGTNAIEHTQWRAANKWLHIRNNVTMRGDFS